jgi:hypothetical protein
MTHWYQELLKRSEIIHGYYIYGPVNHTRNDRGCVPVLFEPFGGSFHAVYPLQQHA